jgi:LCP family protein required for cell wall assembly
VQLVENLTGIPIDHYVEVDFSGFVKIVDEFGGVDLCIDYPMRDEFTGINLSTAGCHHFDGVNALNFVRSRHAEFLKDGEWQEDPDGDLGRIKRQQQFIEEITKKGLATGALTHVADYAAALGSALTFDSTFDKADLLQLIQGFSRPTPDAIDFYSLPGIADDYQGGSYVFPKEPEADNLLVKLGGHPVPDSSLPFGR